MKKYYIKDKESGFYFKEREWVENSAITDSFMDSYFVSDKSAASVLDEAKANFICERFNKVFPKKPVVIEVEE